MSDDVTRVTIGNVSDTIKQLLFLATFKNGELVNSYNSQWSSQHYLKIVCLYFCVCRYDIHVLFDRLKVVKHILKCVTTHK